MSNSTKKGFGVYAKQKYLKQEYLKMKHPADKTATITSKLN